MERLTANIVIESIAAETSKFTAPLVLLHGLWCTPAIWRRFMGYLAHRGWSGHAPLLRGPGHPNVMGLAEQRRIVRDVIAACEAPPVVVGHDSGGWLALQCATDQVRARVALAPVGPAQLLARAGPLLPSLRLRLAMRLDRPLPAPRGRCGRAYFGGDAPGGTVPESARLTRELQNDAAAPIPDPRLPTLVVAGTHDRFVPPSAAHSLAQRIGATFRSLQGAGHALPWALGWEQHAAELHRWLIHSLGEALLVPQDEDDS